METIIGSLETAIHDKRERSRSLQTQLNISADALEKEKIERTRMEDNAKEDLEKSRCAVDEAKQKIETLEGLLASQKLLKEKEMDEMEAKMNEQLDEINVRVE